MIKKLGLGAVLAFLAYVAYLMATSGGLSGDPEQAKDAGKAAGEAGIDAVRNHAPNVDPAANVDKGLSWWDKMMAISPHMPAYLGAAVLSAAAIAFWRWLPGKGRGLLLLLAGVMLAIAIK